MHRLVKDMTSNVVEAAGKELEKNSSSKPIKALGGAMQMGAWGAAIGSAVPGIGTTTGAIVGGLLGFFSSLNK